MPIKESLKRIRPWKQESAIPYYRQEEPSASPQSGVEYIKSPIPKWTFKPFRRVWGWMKSRFTRVKTDLNDFAYHSGPEFGSTNAALLTRHNRFEFGKGLDPLVREHLDELFNMNSEHFRNMADEAESTRIKAYYKLIQAKMKNMNGINPFRQAYQAHLNTESPALAKLLVGTGGNRFTRFFGRSFWPGRGKTYELLDKNSVSAAIEINRFMSKNEHAEDLLKWSREIFKLKKRAGRDQMEAAITDMIQRQAA